MGRPLKIALCTYSVRQSVYHNVQEIHADVVLKLFSSFFYWFMLKFFLNVHTYIPATYLLYVYGRINLPGMRVCQI